MGKKLVFDSRNKKRENILGYTFLAPWLIGFIIFTLFPLLYTLYLSFNDVKLTALGWETTWISIGNYITALLRNSSFTPALINFLIMESIYVPAIVVISFILAIFLNQKIKFRSFFRTIYFLPVIVLSGPVMMQLMDAGNTRTGGVSDIFIFKIIENYSEELAYVIEMLFENFSMVLWFSGIPIILFINGLQKINKNLYEAAQIDGANSWQILWKITIPIIKPIVLVVSIFTIVQLGMFPLNPLYAMIQDSIYNTSGGLGLASAYAWLYSLIIMILIAIAFLFLREKDIKVKRKLSSIQRKQLEKIYDEIQESKKNKKRRILPKFSRKGVR